MGECLRSTGKFRKNRNSFSGLFFAESSGLSSSTRTFNVQVQGAGRLDREASPRTAGLDRRSRNGLLKNFQRGLLHWGNRLLCFDDSFCTIEQISQAVTIAGSLEIADDAFELFVIWFTEILDRRVHFRIIKQHVSAMPLEVSSHNCPFGFAHLSIGTADKYEDSDPHRLFVNCRQSTTFTRVAILSKCIAGKVFHDFA